MTAIDRRAFLAAVVGPLWASAQQRPSGPLVDTHIHLFAPNQQRFPYHQNAPYRPEPRGLDPYKSFVQQAGVGHAVIVHPEPYQDDHRYLEYCFRNEPRPGFFKGTCLFDPIAAGTPRRMKRLVERNPNRIVALRIHEMAERGAPPAVSGAIKNRDLSDPRMKQTWRAAGDLGLAIQMHFRPHYAPPVYELAAQFPEVNVILDHLGRAGMGTEEEFAAVLRLAELPRTIMKLSGVRYSSKSGEPPYLDAKPTVRKAFDAFGPGRILWGGLGYTLEDLHRNLKMLDQLLDYASDYERAQIRGRNAMKLFGFE